MPFHPSQKSLAFILIDMKCQFAGVFMYWAFCLPPTAPIASIVSLTVVSHHPITSFSTFQTDSKPCHGLLILDNVYTLYNFPIILEMNFNVLILQEILTF